MAAGRNGTDPSSAQAINDKRGKEFPAARKIAEHSFPQGGRCQKGAARALARQSFQGFG
jgi:hypothetical protein